VTLDQQKDYVVRGYAYSSAYLTQSASVTVREICQARVVCTERLRGRVYMSRCYCCMGSCRSWSARASISTRNMSG